MSSLAEDHRAPGASRDGFRRASRKVGKGTQIESSCVLLRAPRLRLMAAIAAGVGEALARHRHKLPVVAIGVQGELDYPIGVDVAHLAVWLRGEEGIKR